MTRKRNNDRVGTSCHNKLVIACYHTGLRRHCLCISVDFSDLCRFVKGNAVAFIPGIVMSDDVLIFLLTRKNWRKHQTVVVHPWFCIEYRHIKAIWRLVKQVLQHAPWGHAIADDDEFLFLAHLFTPPLPGLHHAVAQCGLPVSPQ